MYMLGLPRHRRCTVKLASRIYQVQRIKQLAAQLTLIAPRIGISTIGALPFDKPIRQEGGMLLTIRLGGDLFPEVAILMEFPEDVLRDLLLLLGCRPAKVVEADVEPLIDIGVQFMILVAELL